MTIDAGSQLVGSPDPFAGLGSGVPNSGATAPAGKSPSGTPSDAGASDQPKGGKPNSTGLQPRIDELTRQKNDAIRKLEVAQHTMGAMTAQMEQMSQRLTQIEQRSFSPGQPASRASRDWGDLDETELMGLVAGVQDGTVDGQNLGRIVKELVAKQVTAASKGLKENFQKDYRQGRVNEALTGMTVREFGEAVRDPSSDLYQRASRAIGEIGQIRGEDVSGDTLFNFLAFAVADRGLKSQQVTSLQGEIAELKEQVRRLSHTGTEVAERVGEVKEAYDSALKDGNVDAAIKTLSWMRR